MIDKINNLLNTVKEYTWGGVIKFTIIFTLLLLGYIGYSKGFTGWRLFNINNDVELDSKLLKSSEDELKLLLKYDNTVGVLFLIYQPKYFPKTHIELKSKLIKRSHEKLTKYLVAYEGKKIPIDNYIYYELQKTDILVFDGEGSTYIDYVINLYDGVEYVSVYGLYSYGTPVGSIIILHETEPTDELYISNLTNTVRYIDSLLFNEE
jgi:hypothetical protein